MRALIYLICMFITVVGVPCAWADIYTWMDEDGVRHISNLNPPAHAEVLILTEEGGSDEATVQARQAAEKQQMLLREREAQLARQKADQRAELERRLAETEQKTQQLLQETEQRLAAVEARYALWAANRRYLIPATTYVYRPYGGPHYRHKPSRYRSNHRPDHGSGRPSLTGHPFHLGAIHLPLGTIGFARRPYADGAAGHPRHAGGRRH